MKNILFAQTNVSVVITQVFIKVGKTNSYNLLFFLTHFLFLSAPHTDGVILHPTDCRTTSA